MIRMAFILLLGIITTGMAQQSAYLVETLPGNAQLQQEETPEDFPVCGTIFLSDEKAREALENTRLYKPDVYRRMVADKQRFAKRGTVQDTLYTIRKFYVYNLENSTFDEVYAQLRAIGERSQVWVDTAELNNEHVDQTVVDSIFNNLEYRTPATSRDPNKGIVVLDEEYFGDPPNRDGDNKIDFLIVDIQDGWEPGNSYVAGFFLSWDQTSNNGSNQRDILYIDSYPGIYNGQDTNPKRPLSVLAHELQHLIHYNYDPAEETFVNEGLSEMASVICGYPLRNPSTYFSNPDVPLFDWDNISGNVIADYARAAIFTLYYSEQLGDEVLRAVVSNTQHGKNGLDAAFKSLQANRGFETIFQNFCVANVLNASDYDARFGYRYGVSGRPRFERTHTDPNQTVSNMSVHPISVDYVEYTFGDSLTFSVNNPNLNVWVIATGKSDTLVTAASGNSVTLNDFGSKYQSAVMAIVNLTGNRESYGYTSAGKQTAIYVEEKYDDGRPDAFSGSATFLGFGNDAEGYGWAVQFIPGISSNQLVKAKILAGFSQEFSNSTTPADAPKDFEFHVWKDAQGLPGEDLIEPFIFSTSRTSFDGSTFLEIDLSPYAEYLTNVDTVYIGFIENDTVGTYVGMDNSTSTNHTFAFFGPTASNPNRWAPMSNLSVGGNSLSGWNMMMRAVFAYSDPTIPELVVGILQNPILPQYLDVVLLSSHDLNVKNLKGSYTIGSQTKALNFVSIGGSLRQFIDQNVVLTESGTLTIQVEATTRYGIQPGDTTVSYNVDVVQPMVATEVVVGNGNARMAFPRNAVQERLWVISGQGLLNVLDTSPREALTNPVGEIYTIGPSGYRLQSPATVSIAAPSDLTLPPDQVTLAVWKSGKWLALPTTYSESHHQFVAQTPVTGLFTLTRKGDIPALDEPLLRIPETFALYQNFPNPFNPSTIIRYDVPRSSHVTIRVYDMLGHVVKTLVQGEVEAGAHSVEWDGRNQRGERVSSGIYFYRIEAGSFTKTMKMILAK